MTLPNGFCRVSISQIVNYLGQVSTEVKGDNRRLFTIAIECLLSGFVFFCEQSIDHSMSDENLTLQRVETWTVVMKKCGLPVTGGQNTKFETYL